MLPKLPLTVVMLFLLAIFAAACGTIATPRPAFDPTPAPHTMVPRPTNEGAAVSEQPTGIPTTTPTDAPPTALPTELPPTELPPTNISAPTGDPVLGEILFANGLATAPACSTCHLVNEERVQVGPSMVGIAGRAATRVEGLSAGEYLRESITNPNAFLVPNETPYTFSANGQSLMIQTYVDVLSDEDIDNLVAYLLSID